ncbi:DUF4153 domain-containing protein [Mesohalobacter halotolerans]|uniref:DUF4153 domain-containing protein n=1 Tax=Mesohalobacter halotolerans TaxID=1883405 RepID=A0A4U5TTW6_9FLAO|nr:DUF4153 domain-containing protein [Mesohalobacter halotolerans]MBS3738810.1 DUF4153 domain-containing protein [Psychroflexus sp.]TKS57532.1 DUF4153 domain-containing protein [Mesohalobacter halotolerans]
MSFIFNLSQKATSSFKRFPVTLIWAIFGSFYLISVYGIDDFDLIQQNEGFILVLILGVSWLIGSQFLSEALKHNPLNRFAFKLSIIIALALFSYYIYNIEIDISEKVYDRWALLLLAGHIFVGFAPFVNTWHKNKFWNYLKSIIVALFRSGLYAVVLYIGLALAISALELLFDAEFNSNIYLQTFIFCLGIVNTFVYLSDFPRIDKLDHKVDFSKASEVLILYILIPLSLLYMLIVYVYVLKILIDWELPRGWVTYLITALSLLAFLIHIAIEPIRKTHKSKLIQKFFPYYFWSILPLIPLLFIALYRRIAEYNFTELRYLGLVLAIWILGMLIYMIISNKKDLSIYAKSVFLLILLSTFGPLSAFKISINAQYSELEELMQKLDNKPEKSFTAGEFKRFKSIIQYISNRNALNKTKAYFGFDPKLAFSETTTYDLPKKIADSLNIQIIPSNNNSKTVWTYRSSLLKSKYAEEINAYTHFTELILSNSRNNNTPLHLHFDRNNIIAFRYYDEVLLKTDLTNHLKAMAGKYDYLNDAPQQEFSFRFKNDKGDFLMIFDRLSYTLKNNEVKIINGQAKMFYMTYQGLELP